MSTVETWAKVSNLVAECLMCGAYQQLGTATRDQRQARTWARHHAETNAGHHVVVETSRTRSYRSPR